MLLQVRCIAQLHGGEEISPHTGLPASRLGVRNVKRCVLGGGFEYFLFSPLLGEDFQFD